MTIREDAKGRILLTGLHQVTINSIEDLLGALNFGSSIRQTDSTAINAKSSRSHAVFSINLVQRKSKLEQTPTAQKRMSMPLEAMTGNEGWITVDSKLHFVDLAGSERLKNTGASGDRAKEGISINAGLASLGKVISQLSSRQAGSHVSYRDSKLTRLLQDSLGGNAITYMIACVTPAEFHLSETLNTISYAQRARAIQSKPRIQSISDESDKQALIDRLRAEVSFLREQIRNTERGERIGHPSIEKSEKQNEREMELHNHLLDIQENYSALSQRHAKLISEIAKAQDNGSSVPPALNGTAGESAVERLKRSNSFAEAVEQVVLEYEKTIQSLETSLSNTRSSLSTTESSLLERETKCTYVETVNQQLQTRIQKLIDREANTEQYLHDLEAKLDGRASGEEKNSVAMTDLRKEIGRLRENEITNEEYIGTLEERLAEADQDMDLMQREISRLEHVVERQRSLGKLDNLLYELDHIQANDKADSEDSQLNRLKKAPLTGRRRGVSEATLKVAIETAIPESDNEDDEMEGEHPPSMTPHVKNSQSDADTQSPAQSRFVADKLDTVNQELFDLRVEHESTINEYDLLSAKYEEALRTLAALQDSVDESRRPSATLGVPTNFLADARVKELKNAGQSSSSRSLSSELSLAGESPAISEQSDFEMVHHEDANQEAENQAENEDMSEEVNQLKVLHAERDKGMADLSERYAQLQEEHFDTLDFVEELKAEVQKARLSTPASPTSPVIRRKLSQSIMAIDRAHRSLASLGNIAGENFEHKPDTMQNFELNLGVVVSELHERSERVQVLEAELANVKREMETKMAIITGLARERSSLKAASPMDMSMMSAMQNQLLQSENQIKSLHEGFAAREKGLAAEIESLKSSLTVQRRGNQTSRELASADSGGRATYDTKISELEGEILGWQERHQSAVNSMQTSETKLLNTISDLEASLATVATMHERKSNELQAQANTMSATAATFDKERSVHADTVESMNKEIADHKVTINIHLEKITQLEEAHATAQRQINDADEFRQATQKHLEIHRDQISMLEQQLIEHQAAVEFHKHGLKSLHDSHSREVEEARASTMRQAEVDAQSRIAEMTSQHEEKLNVLNSKTIDLEQQLQKHQVALDKHKAIAEERGVTIEKLQQNQSRLSMSTQVTGSDLKEAQARLAMAEDAKAQAEAALANVQAKVEELTWAKTELNEELAELREKEQRASRLVEELEGQLSSTFEDSRATSGRLSLMQSARDQELVNAKAAAAKAQEDIEVLNKRLDQLEVRKHLTVILRVC